MPPAVCSSAGALDFGHPNRSGGARQPSESRFNIPGVNERKTHRLAAPVTVAAIMVAGIPIAARHDDLPFPVADHAIHHHALAGFGGGTATVMNADLVRSARGSRPDYVFRRLPD
jgi:hypothetical protein